MTLTSDQRLPSSIIGAAGPASTGSQFAALFPSIMLPMFLAVVDQTIIAAALPAIARSLGDVERVSWVVVAYLVSTTIAAPVYGQLRDTVGGRRMMFVALSIFIGAAIMCSLSTSVEMLAFARIVQGLGGGGLMTLSQALIGETVPPLERARYQGYLAAIAVTSSTFGPIVGGFLTEHVGWRSVFVINIPIGILALYLTARIKPKPVPYKPWTFDTWGLVYLSAFIIPVLLAVEQAKRLTLPALVTMVVLGWIGWKSLSLLLDHEKRVRVPLLKLDLLAKPAIWRSDAMAACHGAALVSLVTYLPIFFHVRYGTSAAATGIMLLPLMIGIGVGSMVTGQAMSRTGLTMIFPSIGLIFVVFLLLLLSVAISWIGEGFLRFLLLLLGMAMGTVMAVVQITVQRAAGAASLGAAAASIQFSRSVGAAVGTAVVGAVLFAALALLHPEAASVFQHTIQLGPSAVAEVPTDHQQVVHAAIVHAFGAAFFTIAAFAAAALALAWSHPARHL